MDFFSKRRYLNVFAFNQAVISNEIKSSTPAPQKMQNTLGTKTDRLGAEKVKKKKKKLRTFAKENSTTSRCLEA